VIAFFHFLRFAIHNLRRGGQRMLVALLCITFGIMALVAMNMLAQSIASAVEMPAAQLVGGDLSFGRKVEDALRPADIEQLASLKEKGVLSQYTLIAYSHSLTFRTPGSGEMHFVGNGLGVEPEKYPLAGALTIVEPGNIGLPSLLGQAGDVVVTRDVAEEYGLKVGQPLVLADLRTGAPVDGVIRGIASDTPNHQGDKIYYSLETARRLAGDQPVINTVIANTSGPQNAGSPQAALDALEGSGWSVNWAASQEDDRTANLWIIGLRGAGVLGLLVSGIGIANTMQVLLRRRQGEIAIWKTLGYRAGQLRLIFALEAGLLGLAGSLPGAALGVLVSSGLLQVFRRTSTMLYAWTFSWTPPLVGVLVGTLTTILFATWAIVSASQVRPMALLRNEPVDVQQVTGCASIGLVLLLAGLFTALTSLVMESAAAGIGVVICIGIGLAGLAAGFGGALWLCTRIRPLHSFPLARMAVNSLRRRGPALVFAMIALFIGVLSMGAGLAVAQVSERKISGGAGNVAGYNLDILGAAGQEIAIRQAVEAQHPQKVASGYRTALKSLSTAGGEAVTGMDVLLVGRSDPQDYVLSGAEWRSNPDGVYAYKWSNLKAGSRVTATLPDGTARTFPVVGTYDVNYASMQLFPPLGLLLPSEAFLQTTRPDSIHYFVQVAPDQVSHAAAVMGTALPQATVIDLVAYAGRFMRAYQHVYTLPMVMGGLALLGGLLLVANSVSLAMLDRRYEIGILKTLGYSRRQVLSIFAVEYGVAGALSTGAGVLILQGLLVGVALASHQGASAALLGLPALAALLLCGVGLPLLAVLGVAWNPTRVAPAVMLSERN
jgi:putative ABC transport system permease protein